MTQQPAIRNLAISFSSFIPYSVPWDAAFDKVLFKVPRGKNMGKTYVKGPDLTDARAFVRTLAGGFVFPELGNNRSFDTTVFSH